MYKAYIETYSRDSTSPTTSRMPTWYCFLVHGHTRIPTGTTFQKDGNPIHRLSFGRYLGEKLP